MPIFEYNCQACDHRFETIVLSARETVNCPKCASKKVAKQLSVFSARASASSTDMPSGGPCTGSPQTCGCH